MGTLSARSFHLMEEKTGVWQQAGVNITAVFWYPSCARARVAQQLLPSTCPCHPLPAYLPCWAAKPRSPSSPDTVVESGRECLLLHRLPLQSIALLGDGGQLLLLLPTSHWHPLHSKAT